MKNEELINQYRDQFLKALADILKSCCGDGDFACRYGGEEFALILCGKSLEETEKIVYRALHQFSKTQFSFSKKGLTFSGGIAGLMSDDTSESVFKRADHCLYISKQNGKNRVTSDKTA